MNQIILNLINNIVLPHNRVNIIEHVNNLNWLLNFIPDNLIQERERWINIINYWEYQLYLFPINQDLQGIADIFLLNYPT